MSSYLKVFSIAIGLAMDALSVSIASGIKSKKTLFKDALRVALCFGFFQAAMPVIGWAIGSVLQEKVESYTNIIAFVLLLVIGLKMISDSFKDNNDDHESTLTNKLLIGMGIATSIDALVVGTTLSLIDVPLLISILIIGIITFLISMAGYLFGVRLGNAFGQRVEIIGGVVLIAIGITFLFT